MLKKKFAVARMSDQPVEDEHVYGYVLLGQDGEAWRVSRSIGRRPSWKLGDKLSLPLKYIGADEMRPDFVEVEAHSWQPLWTDDPRTAVIYHWGKEFADRFVTPDLEI